MTVPLAGWYPDPSGAADFRWWNGTSWTESVTDDAEAPAPSDPTQSDPTQSDPTPSGEARPARSERPADGHRLVALMVAVTLVVSGGVVGVIGWRNFESARSAAQSKQHHHAGSQRPGSPQSGTPQNAATDRSASAHPSAEGSAGSGGDPSSVSGQLNEVTRRASLDRAEMVLPDEPYELVGNPVSVPDAFDTMFVANAPVHQDFNGSETWAATVGIGHVPAHSWDTENPADFGRKALTGISQQFFGYTPTSVRKLHYRPVTIGSTGCAEITANVHYAIKGLASKFDRVRIIGCPDGTDGSAVAAISSVPDDASDTLTELATKSLNTFHTR